MLMYVDMDFNLVQVLMFVVYQYMYIKLIVFAIISCLHCFVHRIDLSLMLTLIILIIKTGCFSNIIKSLLAVFTYKKTQDMQSNMEINCFGTQNSLRYMYSVDHFSETQYSLLTNHSSTSLYQGMLAQGCCSIEMSQCQYFPVQLKKAR